MKHLARSFAAEVIKTQRNVNEMPYIVRSGNRNELALTTGRPAALAAD